MTSTGDPELTLGHESLLDGSVPFSVNCSAAHKGSAVMPSSSETL